MYGIVLYGTVFVTVLDVLPFYSIFAVIFQKWIENQPKMVLDHKPNTSSFSSLNIQHFPSIKYVLSPSIDHEIAIYSWYTIDVHLHAYMGVCALKFSKNRKSTKNGLRPQNKYIILLSIEHRTLSIYQVCPRS